MGNVSPMFCNMSPFFFYVTRANAWFSDFFSFFDRSGCVYPPKVDAYTSLSSFYPPKVDAYTSLYRVSTKLDVILKLSFLSKHSPRSFISVWCLISYNYQRNHMPPWQIRIKKLSSQGMFADWVSILKISVPSRQCHLVIPFVLSSFSSKNLNTPAFSHTFESQLEPLKLTLQYPSYLTVHLDSIVDDMQANENSHRLSKVSILQYRTS